MAFTGAPKDTCQAGDDATNPTSLTATFALAAAVGEIVLVAVTCSDTGGLTTFSVDDNGVGSNTFTAVANTFQGPSSGQISQCWWCKVTTAATITVRLRFGPVVGTSQGGFCGFAAQLHSGSDASSAIDGSASDTAAAPGTGADAITSGNFTPATDGCLIFSGSLDISTGQNPPTVGTGFTARNSATSSGGTFTQMKTETQVQSSHAAIAGKWTAPASHGGDSFFVMGFAVTPGVTISAALTGTATASITEADVVAGGKTIIITLTGDTWVASGAAFDAQRQNIINGIDSAQAEGTGWDAVVKAGLAVTTVVRTSNTIVTVTLSAFGSYDITAQETITVTIPTTALVTSVAPVIATPTFTVAAAGGFIPGGQTMNNAGLRTILRM